MKENNKLIAEFMDWEKGATEGMYDFPEDFPSYLTDEYHEIPPETMLFYTSWGWLMPVVEKCLIITNNHKGKKLWLVIFQRNNY